MGELEKLAAEPTVLLGGLRVVTAEEEIRLCLRPVAAGTAALTVAGAPLGLLPCSPPLVANVRFDVVDSNVE